eukprot:4315386-Alexandrium_andersonii.AAC.1
MQLPPPQKQPFGGGSRVHGVDGRSTPGTTASEGRTPDCMPMNASPAPRQQGYPRRQCQFGVH